MMSHLTRLVLMCAALVLLASVALPQPPIPPPPPPPPPPGGKALEGPGFPGAPGPGAPGAPAPAPRAVSAHAPNLQVAVHQRTFATGKKALLQLSTYNLKQVQVNLYSVSLESLAPNAFAVHEDDPKVAGSLPTRLKNLKLKGLRPAKSLTVKVIYSLDSWEEKTVAIMGLPPGVYVASASGGGIEQRTWLAVSGRAMLAKRSPHEIVAWVVNATTGQPALGVPVALYNEKGKVETKPTTGEGLVKFAAPPTGTPAWIATQAGDPAFAEGLSPSPIDPYVGYLYADRPVYRPGDLIRFRGTIREFTNGQYALPSKAVETVHAQIKTQGGSTLYDEQLPLNEWGSFNGEFQLAPEPPLGDYELVVTVGKGAKETVLFHSFDVQAYRKPEFTVDVHIDKDLYFNGEDVYFTISAKYFFGSPVSGGKVTYNIQFSEASQAPPAHILSAAGLGTAAIGEIEDSFQGEGRLDKDGQLRLYLKTKHLPYDRTLSISAEVSETALRPRTGSASTYIAASAIKMSLSPDSYEYEAGQTATLTVTTTDREGKPVSTGVTVSFIENLVDREGRSYEETTKKVIETNNEGKADVPFVVRRLGYHQFEAWAKDQDGNPVYDSQSIEVVKKRRVAQWPSLSLYTAQDRYQPGDTAIYRGETNQVGAWMLVTVEGEHIFSSKVYKLQSNEFAVKIPVTEEFKPNVAVRAAIIRKGEMTGANESLPVPFDDKKLTVTITPNQEKYQPAETATYTITTRDSKGAAVPAEVGLGLVDASVYEIRPDSTGDPFDTFWGARSNRIETQFSLENMYPGGGAQGMGEGEETAPPSPAMAAKDGYGGGGAGEAPRVRRFFTDTAYWGPSIVTDTNGTAQVKFLIPDNLTTWRATGRGISQATQAGEARKDVIVTMPLLVRFTLPRFYVQGDEATAAVTVHNYTGSERDVKVTLTAEGVELLEPAEKTIKLENEGIKRLTWKIRVTGKDSAKFLVSADGGPGGKDAMEATLPVKPDGVKDVVAAAGVTTSEETASLAVPGNAVPGSALIEVGLSPSLAGPIFEALDYLTTYPYGCAEQTMDGFLPDMIVAQTLKNLGSSRPRPKMLDRYISFGLQKLLRFQHEDGGWHWWEFDESDPYISAYIVYGLKLADMNGYVAAHGALVRGTEYLRTALDEEMYRDAQAYLLWALTFAEGWRDADDIAGMSALAMELAGQRQKLDYFNRASLALSLNGLSKAAGQEASRRSELQQMAQTIAAELEKEGKPLGQGLYWAADGRYKYSWLDNNVEVTSQVLSALLALKPDSPAIVPAVRWIMAAREGKAWTSTKDTAAAVLVLTRYLEQSKELGQSYTAKVYSGDKLVKEIAFKPEDALKDSVTFAIPATDLQAGENKLRFTKDGGGSLYYSARLSYLLPSKDVVPVAKGITVERRYRIPTVDPSGADTLDPGEVVFVDVTIRTEDNLRYALLQEPIPAGCEVVEGEDDRIPEIGCERREVWDSKLVLYFDYLSRGERTFTYVLRTEAPGNYRILPSMAELMYFPEVRGNSKPVRMKIADVTSE